MVRSFDKKNRLQPRAKVDALGALRSSVVDAHEEQDAGDEENGPYGIDEGEHVSPKESGSQADEAECERYVPRVVGFRVSFFRHEFLICRKISHADEDLGEHV